MPPGGRPAGRPMSVRRLSAAGLAALHRAVNDPTTVERFRSKVVQVPGSQCGCSAGSPRSLAIWGSRAVPPAVPVLPRRRPDRARDLRHNACRRQRHRR